jgi:hypothetical protein
LLWIDAKAVSWFPIPILFHCLSRIAIKLSFLMSLNWPKNSLQASSHIPFMISLKFGW